MDITAIVLSGLLSWTGTKLGVASSPQIKPPTLELVDQSTLNRFYLEQSGSLPSVDIGALYDPFVDTIFLETSFDPDDLYDQSLLVHEIAHYLQDLEHDLRFVSDISLFENEAYRLQASFLKEKGLHMEALLTGIQGSYFLHPYIH